jgi:nucleotide-binding universal stress UspA family protein
MFKDLLVPITGTPGDSDALNMAIDLARSLDAHLSILELVNLPKLSTGPWGLMPGSLVDIYNTLRQQGERNVATLKVRMEQEPCSSEVRIVESLFVEPYQMAAPCAHYADLTIVAGSVGDTAEAADTHAYVGSLIMGSGRPVLVVPPRCKLPMPPRRIVAAWKPSREATRAFHDALPLLRTAGIVDIVVFDPMAGERGHGEQPGADIATHLARHGVNINVVVLQAGSYGIGFALIQHAESIGAQLLVAGGYGHSRFREWALGGTTRDLLIAASVPVLFSH